MELKRRQREPIHHGIIATTGQIHRPILIRRNIASGMKDTAAIFIHKLLLKITPQVHHRTPVTQWNYKTHCLWVVPQLIHQQRRLQLRHIQIMLQMILQRAKWAARRERKIRKMVLRIQNLPNHQVLYLIITFPSGWPPVLRPFKLAAPCAYQCIGSYLDLLEIFANRNGVNGRTLRSSSGCIRWKLKVSSSSPHAWQRGSVLIFIMVWCRLNAIWTTSAGDTASFECCSTSSQRYEEVWSWTVSAYACRPSLARCSWASKVQTHDDGV